jgi:hypothetical protein
VTPPLVESSSTTKARIQESMISIRTVWYWWSGMTFTTFLRWSASARDCRRRCDWATSLSELQLAILCLFIIFGEEHIFSVQWNLNPVFFDVLWCECAVCCRLRRDVRAAAACFFDSFSTFTGFRTNKQVWQIN